MIASRNVPKIFFLNGNHDRETFGMTALDCIQAIVEALNRGMNDFFFQSSDLFFFKIKMEN